jgi:hypothetical protein
MGRREPRSNFRITVIRKPTPRLRVADGNPNIAGRRPRSPSVARMRFFCKATASRCGGSRRRTPRRRSAYWSPAAAYATLSGQVGHLKENPRVKDCVLPTTSSHTVAGRVLPVLAARPRAARFGSREGVADSSLHAGAYVHRYTHRTSGKCRWLSGATVRRCRRNILGDRRRPTRRRELTRKDVRPEGPYSRTSADSLTYRIRRCSSFASTRSCQARSRCDCLGFA